MFDLNRFNQKSKLFSNAAMLLNPKQTNWRSAVQWHFPLSSTWVIIAYLKCSLHFQMGQQNRSSELCRQQHLVRASLPAVELHVPWRSPLLDRFLHYSGLHGRLRDRKWKLPRFSADNFLRFCDHKFQCERLLLPIRMTLKWQTCEACRDINLKIT